MPDALVADAPLAGGLPLPLVPRAAPASAAARPARRRVRALLLILALAVAGGGAWWALSRPVPAPDPQAGRLPEGNVAARLVPGAVLGLGRLVPRGRIVAVAPPYGAGDARIAALPVAEGQRVEAGAVLAVLDSEPVLRAAAVAAEATIAARQAALVQARVTTLSARDDARASLARAEAAIAANRRDLERATALVGRGASTEQVVDQRRVTLEGALADAARARAALLRYDAPAPEEQADILVARRGLDAAAAEADRARGELGKAIVRAPFAGTVLTILARPGARPGNEGILTFGALDDMIAEVEVYENHVGTLRPGMPATLTAAALDAPLTGRVARIGAEVLRQTLTDTSPAANTDARVLRVTVDLDPAAAAAAARVPNLQVTARFTAGAAP